MDTNTLITGLIALISALVGSIAGYLGVMRSARIQEQESRRARLFNTRLEIYSQLYKNYTTYLEHYENDTVLLNLLHSTTVARLIASDNSLNCINNFLGVIESVPNNYSPTDDFQAAFTKLSDSLRNDLKMMSPELFISSFETTNEE